jgi:hypothetical protein
MTNADRKDAGALRGFSRHKLNPVEQLQRLDWPSKHVTFDPTLKHGTYFVRRGTAHDGTLIFSDELIRRALVEIAKRQGYWKGEEPDWSKLRGIRYRVGWMKVAIVYGMVDLPIGRYPGQRESIRMWVVPEYVY